VLHQEQAEVYLAGEGAAGVLSVYAALLEPDVAGLVLFRPPLSHMDAAAPALLNVLRVCDIAESIGLLAPRPVTAAAVPSDWSQRVAAVYRVAGAREKFVVRE
jgi:hypothetical protein